MPPAIQPAPEMMTHQWPSPQEEASRMPAAASQPRWVRAHRSLKCDQAGMDAQAPSSPQQIQCPATGCGCASVHSPTGPHGITRKAHTPGGIQHMGPAASYLRIHWEALVQWQAAGRATNAATVLAYHGHLLTCCVSAHVHARPPAHTCRPCRRWCPPPGVCSGRAHSGGS
jgi:hypothetical protein